MARISDRYRHGVLGEINITPLLDLCFVLIIIFMITTPLMEQKLNIDLPQSTPLPVEKMDPRKLQQVAVRLDGKIFLERQEITLDQLKAKLFQIKAADPEAVIALRADKDLPYQKLIDVLDVVKATGIKMGLSTRPENIK
jgi:biopolymer transport protein ExbD